jgi:hypothetical protein
VLPPFIFDFMRGVRGFRGRVLIRKNSVGGIEMIGRIVCAGLVVLALVLSGCNQVLGGMPDKMDGMTGDLKETNRRLSELYAAMNLANDFLSVSVHALSEMERLQTLGGAVAIVQDRAGEMFDSQRLVDLVLEYVRKEKGEITAEKIEALIETARESKTSNYNFRVRMAQVMIAVADVGLEKPMVPGVTSPRKHREDQLYEYIGALGPLKFPALPYTTKKTKEKAEEIFERRNVAIVSDDPRRDASVLNVPIDKELYRVYEIAASRMSRKISAAVSDNNYEEKILRERALNLFYAGTAIMGASEGIAGAEVRQQGREVVESYASLDEDRSTFATELVALHDSLRMEEQVKSSTVRLLVETRLGVSLPKKEKP